MPAREKEAVSVEGVPCPKCKSSLLVIARVPGKFTCKHCNIEFLAAP